MFKFKSKFKSRGPLWAISMILAIIALCLALLGIYNIAGRLVAIIGIITLIRAAIEYRKNKTIDFLKIIEGILFIWLGLRFLLI